MRMEIKPDEQLNFMGKICPYSEIKARKKFNEMEKGKVLEVLALDKDLEIRSIVNKAGAILVGYDGFVGLIEKNKVLA